MAERGFGPLVRHRAGAIDVANPRQGTSFEMNFRRDLRLPPIGNVLSHHTRICCLQAIRIIALVVRVTAHDRRRCFVDISAYTITATPQPISNAVTVAVSGCRRMESSAAAFPP